MKSVSRFIAVVFVFPVLLAGCHGGSTSSFLPTSGAGTASFTISVPAAAPGQTAAIQSASIALTSVNGNAAPASIVPLKTNLSKSTPGCTAASDGSLSCVVKMAAPAGNDTFVVTTYAGANQLGSQVSGSSVTTRIAAGRTTVCLKQQTATTSAAGK